MDTITLQWEVVPIVKSSLEMKRKALEFNLDRYKERLAAFENQYEMESDDFAAKFSAGELGDEADWFEWQYLLDVYHETLRQLQPVGRKQQA
jgi:hypothetical protein